MKKLIALTLALVLLAGCAPAVYDGPTESAWVPTSLHTIHYDPEYGNETALVTYAYDSMGNQVRVTTHRSGEMLQEMKYQYDDRGNQIRRILWDHSGWFSFPVSRATYTYDDRNRPLTSVFRNGFGFKTGSDTYTYDDEANTVIWEGTHDTQTKYLNEKGDPVRVVTFSKPAGIEIESLYEYDALGQLIKTIEYLDGTLSSTSEKRYDELGRILEDTWYDADGGILMRTTYQYTENTVTTWDKDGRKGVKTLRPDGQVAMLENYDQDGNLITRSVYTYTEIQIPAEEE